MSRYWVIAPFESKDPKAFDKVWQFDVTNNLISIGWSELGDISDMSRESLTSAVASTYPAKPLATQTLYCNMLWNFYHGIVPGDFVIARRGRKTLAAVGRVTESAAFAPKRNPLSSHTNFLGVVWQEQPRDKVFPGIVFPMHTLMEISEVQYRSLVEGSGVVSAPPVDRDEIVDQGAFVLEKYLEDFIVSNFDNIFKNELRIYEDGEEVDGQQFPTDIGPIDILAVDPKARFFTVIELKKGRPSDQVVGQILRYMGWVKRNLCRGDQEVRGLVICHEADPKLAYALEMTKNIDVRYYRVSFSLRETP